MTGSANRIRIPLIIFKLGKRNVFVLSDGGLHSSNITSAFRLRAEEELRRQQEARERQERAAMQAEEERVRREEDRRNKEDEERRQKEQRWKDMQDQLDREVSLHQCVCNLTR